ncbi:hypothetical protein Efla_005656 [Eimeria flavescens]
MSAEGNRRNAAGTVLASGSAAAPQPAAAAAAAAQPAAPTPAPTPPAAVAAAPAAAERRDMQQQQGKQQQQQEQQEVEEQSRRELSVEIFSPKGAPRGPQRGSGGPSGGPLQMLGYVDKTEGSGRALQPGDFAWIEFEGRKAATGEVIDTSERYPWLVSVLLRPFSLNGGPWGPQGGPYLVRVLPLDEEEAASSSSSERQQQQQQQQQEQQGDGLETPVDANVIEGLVRGICGMKKGGKRELIVPPQMAYGKLCKEVLIYEVRVVGLGPSPPPRTFLGRLLHAIQATRKQQQQQQQEQQQQQNVVEGKAGV